MKKLTFFWLLLCVTALPVLAQQEQNSSVKTLKFASVGKWQSDNIYLSISGKMKELKDMNQINIKDMSYSKSFVYNPKSPLILYRKTDDKEQMFKKWGTIIIPKEIQEPVILLKPRLGKLRYKVLEVSPKLFPFGSIKFYNASHLKMGVMLGKELKPLELNAVCKFPKVNEDKTNAWLRVQTLANKKMVLSSMMTRRKDKRMLIVLVNDKDRKGDWVIKSRMLVDFAPLKVVKK